MKKLKVASLLLACCTLVSVFGSTASAQYLPFAFNIKTSVNSGVGRSGVNIKNDGDVYAHVYTYSSNIVDSTTLYYRSMAYSGGWIAASGYAKVSKSNQSHVKPRYNSGYNWAGAKRYLEADTDRNTVNCSGNWHS